MSARLSHPRLSPPEGEEQQEQPEEMAPVAFRENGLLKPLSGVEDISAQQEAGREPFQTAGKGDKRWSDFTDSDFLFFLF